MRFSRRILAFAVTLVMILANSWMVHAEENVYSYKITVESDKWFEYTVCEKVDMLHIEENKLKAMSDEQLVQEIADYPYLIDIYAYDSMEEGLKIFSENCDAFSELMSREGGVQSFEKYANELIESYDIKCREDGRTDFVKVALADIIEYYESENETDGLCYSTTVPKTPNENAVPYTMPSEPHTTAYHNTLDNEVVSTYGVTLVRTGSCKYNCHSYAWHSTSSTNKYWISNPSIYMTDGSYTRKFLGSTSTATNLCYPSVNDKIYYASNTHSAIFVGNPSSGIPLATSMARSKWGKLGVFEHTISNVPSGYDTSLISIWHR